MKRVYYFFAQFVPEWIKAKVKVNLDYAGLDESEDEWIGRAITLTLLLFIIPPLLELVLRSYGLYFITREYCLLCFASGFFLFLTPFAFWLHLRFVISARVDRVEEVFSDFLYNIASNLNGGMVPMQAFLSAAKPEYGVLGKEALRAYEKEASTGFVTEAFKQLGRRVKSIYLKNFAAFFERALVAGGKLAALLEAYADYFRDLQLLKKDLADRTRNFTVFILIISSFIMPFLTAVAYTYVLSLIEISAQLETIGTEATFAVSFTPKVGIDQQTLLLLLVAYIFASAILTSFLIGVVSRGKIIFGFKYLPLLLIISVGMFFLAQIFLAKTLGIKGTIF